MEQFNWETEQSHSNNTETMNDYLETHLPEHFHLVIQDGSYAEVQSSYTAQIYAVHASGNGDFNHHSVKFELLS